MGEFSRLLFVRDGFLVGGLLYHHVVKLFGVKDFATFHALDIFGVVVPGDNSYLRVFAGGYHLGRINRDELLFPPIVAAFSSFSSAKLMNRFSLGTLLGVANCPRRLLGASGGGLKYRQKLEIPT